MGHRAYQIHCGIGFANWSPDNKPLNVGAPSYRKTGVFIADEYPMSPSAKPVEERMTSVYVDIRL